MTRFHGSQPGGASTVPMFAQGELAVACPRSVLDLRPVRHTRQHPICCTHVPIQRAGLTHGPWLYLSSSAGNPCRRRNLAMSYPRKPSAPSADRV
jgi:hypothetical protein